MRQHSLQDTALRYFMAVADTGSLTEASARQHVAASALSRQIAALEAQLGVALFERHPRGMGLTAAGEILRAHARRAEAGRGTCGSRHCRLHPRVQGIAPRPA